MKNSIDITPQNLPSSLAVHTKNSRINNSAAKKSGGDQQQAKQYAQQYANRLSFQIVLNAYLREVESTWQYYHKTPDSISHLPDNWNNQHGLCLLYTSPSPRDRG